VPEQIAPGVYRVEVTEYAGGGETPAKPVGTSTFTLGHRQWLRADGAGEDWAVTSVILGE
jgi:hypothetical protein